MQPLPRRSHYEAWERETDSAGGRSDRRAARYMERNLKKAESRTWGCCRDELGAVCVFPGLHVFWLSYWCGQGDGKPPCLHCACDLWPFVTLSEWEARERCREWEGGVLNSAWAQPAQTLMDSSNMSFLSFTKAVCEDIPSNWQHEHLCFNISSAGILDLSWN